ncbi:MAG TPA: metallophosphoesterase [Holophagaceae bacterium]|jgi:5'-nucleotidase|nr:metallophosphoesterase [Holophagaceae bacterium]
MKRRDFLGTMAAAGAAPFLPLRGASADSAARITLLHTNDTHDHLDPFPAGTERQSGLGGIARRATLVKRLRKELGNVLLLDAGDAFQGTPYFNEWKGRLDFKLMSLVGYDAVTLGNHDFDDGVDGLLDAMREATFPFVCANLDFSGAPALARRVSPYLIRQVGGVRVGVLGATVAFNGLVLPENHKGVEWLDPIAALTPLVKRLREEEHCDLIVLTSHLGIRGENNRAGNLEVAAQVPGIHAIISGHTHIFMEEPAVVKNALGETIVFEVGYGGTELGRLDFSFRNGKLAAWSRSAVQGA